MTKFRTMRYRRIPVIYGIMLNGIRHDNHHTVESRRLKIDDLENVGFPARFLGANRGWAPLPAGLLGTNSVDALAHARPVIELLQAKAARVDDLEAETALLRRELALLRNVRTNSYYGVTNGEEEPPTGPPGDSYETADPLSFQEAHRAVGQPGAPNGPPDNPPVEELVMAGRSPRFPRTIRFQTAMPVAGQQCPGVCQGCE